MPSNYFRMFPQTQKDDWQATHDERVGMLVEGANHTCHFQS